MRTVVDAKAFHEALKKASAATAKTKHNAPSEQVCVNISDGICRVTGTDCSTWVSAELPAQGEGFSFVFQNTGKILRVCKHFSGNLTLELTTTAHRYGRNVLELSLSCGERSAMFSVCEDQGVHELPLMDESVQTYQINAHALLERVQHIRYAAGRSNDRPYLNGIRFQDKRIWSIDGYRMAVNEDEHLTVRQPFILPMPALLRLKECGQADVELSVGENYARFSGEGILLYCRVLTAKDSLTPESVIPKNLPNCYRINRNQYLDELKYLTECVSKPSNTPVLYDAGRLIAFDNGAMIRTAVDVIGNGSDQHALNMRFILEALGQFAGSEYVTLHSGGRYSPVVITAEGAGTAFIMPVRAAKSWGRLEPAA